MNLEQIKTEVEAWIEHERQGNSIRYAHIYMLMYDCYNLHLAYYVSVVGEARFLELITLKNEIEARCKVVYNMLDSESPNYEEINEACEGLWKDYGHFPEQIRLQSFNNCDNKPYTYTWKSWVIDLGYYAKMFFKTLFNPKVI